MYLPSKYLLTCCLLLLFCGTPTDQAPGQNPELPNDTIRVLLFDEEPARDLSIGARDAAIRLSWDEGSEQLNPEASNITIAPASPGANALNFRLNGKSRQTSALIVSSGRRGLIQIKRSGSPNRYYDGKLQIYVDSLASDSTAWLRLINYTPLEAYVGGVIAGEMDFKDPSALKAQAVISRTYALWSMQNYRDKPYDLTDHISNQVFPGIITYKPRFAEAARTSHAEVLTWSGKLIFAPFSSTCGGYTSNNEGVWNGEPLPYLRTVDDHKACADSPHYRWNFRIERNELKNSLSNAYGLSAGALRIDSTNSQGRALKIALGNTGQNSFAAQKVMDANEFRLFINNHFGIRSLRSSWFDIVNQGDAILFRGKGMGHGVGLCQWGALDLAEAGWNYRQILKFYYKGVKVVDYHSLDHSLRALPLAK